MCGAFRVKNSEQFPNLTPKKTRKALLSRCKWGHDDCSLEITDLPVKLAEAASDTLVHLTTPSTRRSNSSAWVRAGSQWSPRLLRFWLVRGHGASGA